MVKATGAEAEAVEPAGAGEGSSLDVQPPAASPPADEQREPSPRMVLWCSTPAGAACAGAAASLGVQHTEAALIPKALLEGFQDLRDDCQEAGIARLTLQLSGDLQIPPDMWVYQGGASLRRQDIPRVSFGGGCVTGANPSIPAVKIHTQPLVGGALFLIRVWEAGQV